MKRTSKVHYWESEKKLFFWWTQFLTCFWRTNTPNCWYIIPGHFSLGYSRNLKIIWEAMECCHRVLVFYSALSFSTSSRKVYLHVLCMPFFSRTDGARRLCYVQNDPIVHRFLSHEIQADCWAPVCWAISGIWYVYTRWYQVSSDRWVLVFESCLKIQSKCMVLA